MKKLIILIGLFVSLICFSQDFELFYHGKKYREVKRVREKFDRSGYYRGIFFANGWYVKLEIDDMDKYNKIFWIKFYRIPIRKRKNVELIPVFILDDLKINDWNEL